MQKQCDVLDSRIQEVSVNNISAGTLNVEVFDAAHADEKPVRPNKALSLGIALLAGLLLGTGIVVAQEWRDKRVRTPDDIAGLLEIPMLGMVPVMEPRLSLSERGQIVHGDSMSEVSEAFRAIRTMIHFSAAREARTLLVTSPTCGEGKSTCSSNLAISLAQAGHRTLLVDCDLRRPIQHRIFHVDGSAGISDVMTGNARLRDAIRPTSVDGLFLLPCGTILGSPAEMLESKRFAQVMQALSSAFDRVVIDSPPVNPVTDAQLLAASADATIVVLRMHWSTRKLSALAMEGLHKVGASVLGAIANQVQAVNGYEYYRDSGRATSAGRHLAGKIGIGGVNGKANAARDGNGKPALSDESIELPAEIRAISEPESPADARWSQAAGKERV
jgi:capsular exopolysaccharide synthesis family protein